MQHNIITVGNAIMIFKSVIQVKTNNSCMSHAYHHDSFSIFIATLCFQVQVGIILCPYTHVCTIQ